ncbi:MAG: hypothetical protein LC640_13050, partial [Frankia sp.]|nr:hypothetical protein [Frankia sp.]
ELAALPGARPGVFVFEYPRECCAAPATLFGGSLWLTKGQLSLLALTAEPEPTGHYLESVVRGFADRPVFLITEVDAVPAATAPLVLTRALRIDGTLPMWDESDVARPAHAHRVPVGFTVWRLSLP